MGATCRPQCNVGAADCDSNPTNGCEATNTNPTCSNGAPIDVTVIGDTANSGSTTGTTERFVRVRIRESLSADVDLTARLALQSGQGTDYDLYVYCPNCAATAINEADNSIEVGRDDISNNDRSFEVWAEIRLDTTTAQTTCAAWTLTVTGNVTTQNRCAN
jgi:hypothetical protein